MKKLLFVIVLVAAIFSIFAAPKLEVTSFETDAKDLKNAFGKNAVYDRNKDLCATIRVETDLTETISIVRPSESYGTPDRRITGITYFFISAREGIIKFVAPGFEPLVYSIPRANLPLKKGATYVVKLTSKNQVLGNIPVTIITEPADAQRFVDEVDFETKNTILLSKGAHTLKLVKAGYKSIERQIDVNLENVYFGGDDYKMESINQVAVSITSKPVGATILLDGEVYGNTNTDLFLYPGLYRLELKKDLYINFEREIEIRESGKNSFSFDLTKNASYIEVKTSPVDVEVFVDGQDRSGERQNIEVFPGSHTIELKKESYLTKKFEVNLKLGEVFKIDEILTKERGTILANISPKDASLIIDRKDYKTQREVELAPGRYTINISKEGYIPQEQQVSIAIGQQKQLEVSLVKNEAFLELAVVPKDAVIIVNRSKYSSGSKIALPPGSYNFLVEKAGYESYRKNVNLRLKQTYKESIVLKQRLGKLMLKVEQGLDVSFRLEQENKKVESWKGSVIKVLLEGEYNLQGSLSGYRRYKKNISIKKEKTTQLNVVMKQGDDPLSYTESELDEQIDKYRKNKYIALATCIIPTGIGALNIVNASKSYKSYEQADNTNDAVDFRQETEKYSKNAQISLSINIIPIGLFWYNNYRQNYFQKLKDRR